jgi:hypothetical protein
MGLFEEPAWPDGEPAQAAAEVSATARPSFPEDLALACSGKPVAEARAYRAVPSLMHWPSSMAAGSCTPRGSNGLVRNVHVLEVRVFAARTGKLLSGRRFPSRAAVKSGAGMSFTTGF